MGATLARLVYSTLLRLLLPLLFARLWWRGRKEPAYRRHWRQRLGGWQVPPQPGRVWLHAVSLGETRAAAPLVAALRRLRPDIHFLFTHGTATGRHAGHQLRQDGDALTWLPLDTPGAVRRFLRHHRPLVGVLMETEIWPNLLHAAQQHNVPVLLANARLSQRSLERGQRFAALLQPAVASLARVLAQTGDDARRLRQAGARQVVVHGNLKFDIAPPARLLARGIEWRQALSRSVVLAASTREGEEAMLLDAWAALPAPRPLLLVVPRHPTRFDAVAALVATAGLTLARRSSWQATPPVAAATADVWLGDSLGEMPLYYAVADVALLGGSFAPLGGHNLIEAAACGCPLVMGPHTFNFAQAAELSLAAGAAERVATLAEAVPRAVALAQAGDHNRTVQRALDFAAEHRGAAERMARAVVGVLPQPRRR